MEFTIEEIAWLKCYIKDDIKMLVEVDRDWTKVYIDELEKLQEKLEKLTK